MGPMRPSPSRSAASRSAPRRRTRTVVAAGLAAALALAGCTGSEEEPAQVVTAGEELDPAQVVRAVERVRRVSGADEFYTIELDTIAGRLGGRSVVAHLTYPSEGEPAAVELRHGRVRPARHSMPGRHRPARRVPIDPVPWDSVDLAAVAEALVEPYATYYDCTTRIESAQYQARVTSRCDGDPAAPMTGHGERVELDTSSAEGIGQALDLVRTGAPATASHVHLRGPQQDPQQAEVEVDFVDGDLDQKMYLDGDHGVHTFRGPSPRKHDGAVPGGQFSLDRLDPAALAACADTMVGKSGGTSWSVGIRASDSGEPVLRWDARGAWDPDQTESVTNDRCEPVEVS